MALFDLVSPVTVLAAVDAGYLSAIPQTDLLEEMRTGESVPSRKQLEKLAKDCSPNDAPLRNLIDELASVTTQLARNVSPDDLVRLAGDDEAANDWLAGADWPVTHALHERFRELAGAASGGVHGVHPAASAQAPLIQTDPLHPVQPSTSSQMREAFDDMRSAFDRMYESLSTLGFPTGEEATEAPTTRGQSRQALKPPMPFAQRESIYPARVATAAETVEPRKPSRPAYSTKERNRALAAALRALGKRPTGDTWERAKHLLAAGCQVEEAAHRA